MNSRQRIQAALDHKEPDQIPFDLGASNVTGIHVQALQRLRQHVNLPEKPATVVNRIEQIGLVEEDLRTRLQVDVEGIWLKTATGFQLELQDRGIVFWGGGVDTQHILGDGTPNEVRAEVRQRIADLATGGGFVFATVHCIQANVHAEKILALVEELHTTDGN